MGFVRFLCEVILLGALSFGFTVPALETNPSDNPTKGYLLRVSVHNLTSGYLKRIHPDVNYLKISKSKIERIDRHAFDHLIHLNFLEISDSEIEDGFDPEMFYRLPGLEILVLKNLHLQKVSLNLSNVQELVLAGNEIETFDGRAVTGGNINFVDLSNNKLKILAGNFGNLTKLSMIDLSKNKLIEISNVFEKNLNLQTILASDNKITSTEGFRLPWLKSLDLFSNKIISLSESSFSKMASLQELMLAFNNIEQIGDAFRDLTELKVLNLAWNNVEELHPFSFRNNLYLTKLSLQGNRIKTLERFQNVLPHLTHLDVSHNQLSVLEENFFHSTPSLQVLDLSFNRLKSLSNVLEPLTELKILNVAFNEIDLAGDEFKANNQLIRANLSSNSLTGGFKHFEYNFLLNDLDLSDNKISYICDGCRLKRLLRLDLSGNKIKNLDCLRDFQSLCEVDVRNNPLVCGDELDALMMSFVARKASPFKLTPEFQADLLVNQCENLSLNRSLNLWNSVRLELCPEERVLELKAVGETKEWDTTEDSAAESFEMTETTEESVAESLEMTETSEKARKKPFIILPIGWIKNDEMNKPNPLQSPQSERTSWEKIEENAEFLKGFEDEEQGKRPRFSWYTIALILIGLSLTLTCFNLVVFLYVRLKVFKRAGPDSPQRYTFLHNEVYKNTTEPTKVTQPEDSDWTAENQMKNKIFTYGKINELLINFRLSRKDQDSESAKNILIGPANVQNS